MVKKERREMEFTGADVIVRKARPFMAGQGAQRDLCFPRRERAMNCNVLRTMASAPVNGDAFLPYYLMQLKTTSLNGREPVALR
jgi:hypothetical protein